MTVSLPTLPASMRAMVLERPGTALVLQERPLPELRDDGQVLLRVRACGVCRTDLHLVDGELPDPLLPVIPGHQIVGEVVATGAGVNRFQLGARVGVPWLGSTDGSCRFCLRGQENLCPEARFTGYTLDGGYAEYAVADARYCFPLPAAAEDLALAPLLCAGLIGYRTWRLAGGTRPQRLGIYGFGAAAHIITQVAVHHGQQVYAFTREGDREAQDFARRLGAVWAGSSTTAPPEVLDAAMVFAPAGELMVTALEHVDRGGTVVSGGIHMSDIPSFPYHLLWQERTLTSVANLTREDGEEFLALAAAIPVSTEVTTYALEDANQALADLRQGNFTGAAVLLV
tara:strand:- start:27600 stop:28625 length:1026 start_codon:yes stop_codon:yes gene_type:complete